MGDNGTIRQSDKLGDVAVRWAAVPELTISGQPGQTCRIESSDGLSVSWVERDNLQLTDYLQVWQDLDPNLPAQRFCRAAFSP